MREFKTSELISILSGIFSLLTLAFYFGVLKSTIDNVAKLAEENKQGLVDMRKSANRHDMYFAALGFDVQRIDKTKY